MLREQPRHLGRPCRKAVRNTDARNKLATENARLVGWSVARFFRRLDPSVANSYPRVDAQGDAWTGFLRACELWEPCRSKLSAYAWLWMRQAMQNGLRAALNLIHNPSRVPETRVLCVLMDDWSDCDVPAEEDVLVLVCRIEVMEALDEALGRIDRKQARVIRMRLEGSTWTEVARKLKTSIPGARAVEQAGLRTLREELKEVEDLT